MAYTKKWYQENREAIAEKRRRMYRDDPEYREQVLAQSKAYRERKAKEREDFLKNPYIEIDGKTVAAKTVDDLFDMTGIDKARLKYLQKAGYIPPALVSRPVRLYTFSQIEYLRQLEKLLEQRSHLLRSTRSKEGVMARAALKKLTTTIHKNWSK